MFRQHVIHGEIDPNRLARVELLPAPAGRGDDQPAAVVQVGLQHRRDAGGHGVGIHHDHIQPANAPAKLRLIEILRRRAITHAEARLAEARHPRILPLPRPGDGVVAQLLRVCLIHPEVPTMPEGDDAPAAATFGQCDNRPALHGDDRIRLRPKHRHRPRQPRACDLRDRVQ